MRLRRFAVKCGKCSEPVIGECVNALGVGYHPEHFCCEMCKTTLEVRYCNVNCDVM